MVRLGRRHLLPQSRARRVWSALSLPVALLLSAIVTAVASDAFSTVGLFIGALTLALLVVAIRWIEGRWDSSD